MPEIRLDVRLLRPGALVAGVAAGRCVLVRAVPEPGGAAAWIAAAGAGLPVPAVRETRCGERHVLVAAVSAGQPLSPAVGDRARSQAAALGQALAAHGIAVGRLRRDDLQVCDGVLAVRAPVSGEAESGDEAAFSAMVAAACAPEPAAEVRRGRRAVPVAIVAVAVLAVAVTLVPWPGAGGREAPRAAAAVPRVVGPEPAPAPVAEPQPPTARVRTPAVKPKAKRVRAEAKAKAKVRKRRPAPAAAADATVRVPPAPPARRPAAQPPADDIPVAGGEADPLPAR